MSLRLRDTDRRPRPARDVTDDAPSPPATRQRRHRWRDPRLWLGIALVLVSVVVGARVLASADDTIAVWQVTHDVQAGDPVGSSDVRSTRVHFDDAAVGQRYLPAGSSVLLGAHATRDLSTGEILAGSAVSAARVPVTRQLPLGVGATHEPADLRVGDHVEVWAVPSSSGSAVGRPQGTPTMVLRDVTVVSVGGGGSVGVEGERQVLVALDATVDVGSVLRATSGASVVLVRLAS